jgi:hypothetical protein
MTAELKEFVFMSAKISISAVALALMLRTQPPQPLMDSSTVLADSLLTPEDLQHLGELLQLLEEPSEEWQDIKRTETVVLLKKDLGNSPVAVIKAYFRLDGLTAESVFRTIWDSKYRQEWDNVLKEFTVLEQYNSQSDLAYFYVESPTFLVSNREFLQRRVFTKTADGAWVIVYWSVEKTDVPVRSGWVRAHTSISGYRIRPSESGCVLDYLSHNDAKGYIPPFLINAVAPSKALEWSVRMQAAAARLLD